MSQLRINTVGIVSPGDMGHAIGRVLRQNGLNVVACLRDRSERTKRLSNEAGIREVDSLPSLVSEADLVLSILVPSQAESAATVVSSAIQESGATTHYVDCNAISPDTVKRIDATIQAAGATFSDGSIIGLPPGPASAPRLYVAGAEAATIRELDDKGISVKYIGPEIGQASGIKMCYAAMTKGTFALQYALSMVAERLNLLDELLDEFEFSQPDAYQRMHKVLPKLPAKAWRWVGEMEQIASTFESLNMTPHFHEGAAEIYDLISKTTLGKETPETIDQSRTLESTIAEISRQSEDDKSSGSASAQK